MREREVKSTEDKRGVRVSIVHGRLTREAGGVIRALRYLRCTGHSYEFVLFNLFEFRKSDYNYIRDITYRYTYVLLSNIGIYWSFKYRYT